METVEMEETQNDDPLRKEKEYKSFARRFPTLLHTCGLAQAVAFGLSEKRPPVVDDLADVLEIDGGKATLARNSRELKTLEYMQLNREALAAAGWIKRYAEALLRGDDQ